MSQATSENRAEGWGSGCGTGPAGLKPATPGLTDDEVRAGIRALESADPPYIDVEYRGGDAIGHVVGVSERARRELGAWPAADSLVQELAEALARAAKAEPELEKKTRLRAVADGLAGAARDIAVAVISKRLGTS